MRFVSIRRADDWAFEPAMLALSAEDEVSFNPPGG